MDREQVISKISEFRLELQDQFGVQHLYLFGSFSRNEASPDSDIDFLVEFSRPTGLFGLASLQLYLEDKLGRKVDIGTPQSLKPYIREEVERDALLVT
jgi:uncharacterized protein